MLRHADSAEDAVLAYLGSGPKWMDRLDGKLCMFYPKRTIENFRISEYLEEGILDSHPEGICAFSQYNDYSEVIGAYFALKEWTEK